LSDPGKRLTQVRRELVELWEDIKREPFWWRRPLTADQRKRIQEIREELDAIKESIDETSREALVDRIKRLEFRGRD
jgi:prephenate dehydrogenase